MKVVDTSKDTMILARKSSFK